MEETNEQSMTGATVGDVPAFEPDTTLVQPRFDVREERTAQPVVPLAATPARRRSSSLPVALILVSAVVGGLVSVLAYRTYQRRPAPPAAQEQAQQQQTPTAEASAEGSPTPELVAAEAEVEQHVAQPPAEQAETAVAETAAPGAATASRVERTVVKEDRKSEAAAARRAPQRTNEDAKPERAGGEPARARRVDVFTGPTGERVSRRKRGRDDSEMEGEAIDYETPAERRARRRAARRGERRNVDRVRAIFEGDPPRPD